MGTWVAEIADSRLSEDACGPPSQLNRGALPLLLFVSAPKHALEEARRGTLGVNALHQVLQICQGRQLGFPGHEARGAACLNGVHLRIGRI